MIMLSKGVESGDNAEPWRKLVSNLSNLTGTEKSSFFF